MGLFSDVKVNYIDRENFAYYGELSNPQRYWARDNAYQSGIVDELIKMSQTYNFDTIVKIDIGKPNFVPCSVIHYITNTYILILEKGTDPEDYSDDGELSGGYEELKDKLDKCTEEFIEEVDDQRRRYNPDVLWSSEFFNFGKEPQTQIRITRKHININDSLEHNASIYREYLRNYDPLAREVTTRKITHVMYGFGAYGFSHEEGGAVRFIINKFNAYNLTDPRNTSSSNDGWIESFIQDAYAETFSKPFCILRDFFKDSMKGGGHGIINPLLELYLLRGYYIDLIQQFFGGVIKWIEFADRLGVRGITPEALYKSDLYCTSKVVKDSFFRPEGIKNINEKIIDRLIFLSTKEGTILPERAEPVIKYFKAFNKYNFN